MLLILGRVYMLSVCVFAGGFARLSVSAGLDVQKHRDTAAAKDGLRNCRWADSPSQIQLPAQVALLSCKENRSAFCPPQPALLACAFGRMRPI